MPFLRSHAGNEQEAKNVRSSISIVVDEVAKGTFPENIVDALSEKPPSEIRSQPSKEQEAKRAPSSSISIIVNEVTNRVLCANVDNFLNQKPQSEAPIGTKENQQPESSKALSDVVVRSECDQGKSAAENEKKAMKEAAEKPKLMRRESDNDDSIVFVTEVKKMDKQETRSAAVESVLDRQFFLGPNGQDVFSPILPLRSSSFKRTQLGMGHVPITSTPKQQAKTSADVVVIEESRLDVPASNPPISNLKESRPMSNAVSIGKTRRTRWDIVPLDPVPNVQQPNDIRPKSPVTSRAPLQPLSLPPFNVVIGNKILPNFSKQVANAIPLGRNMAMPLRPALRPLLPSTNQNMAAYPVSLNSVIMPPPPPHQSIVRPPPALLPFPPQPPMNQPNMNGALNTGITNVPWFPFKQPTTGFRFQPAPLIMQQRPPARPLVVQKFNANLCSNNQQQSLASCESIRQRLPSKLVNMVMHGKEANDDESIPAKNDRFENLRPVIIDGSNVAIQFGKNKVFDAKAILICARYYLAKGHQVMAFVSQFRSDDKNRHEVPTRNAHLLSWMHERDLLTFTPCRSGENLADGSRRKQYSCYEDFYIVEYADKTGGVIVSNDRFLDLRRTHREWRHTIDNRVLMYSWVRDYFMPARDPFGKYGPLLEQVLSYGSGENRPSTLCAWSQDDLHRLLHRIDDVLKSVAQRSNSTEPNYAPKEKAADDVRGKSLVQKKKPKGKKRGRTADSNHVGDGKKV